MYCLLRWRAGPSAPTGSLPLAKLPTARTIELTRCFSPAQSRLVIASKTFCLPVGASR